MLHIPDATQNEYLGCIARPIRTHVQSEHTTIQRLVVTGYITALAMPPLGFAIGLVLMLSARLRSKHAVWIVLVSIIAAILWALLIRSGALKDTNQAY